MYHKIYLAILDFTVQYPCSCKYAVLELYMSSFNELNSQNKQYFIFNAILGQARHCTGAAKVLTSWHTDCHWNAPAAAQVPSLTVHIMMGSIMDTCYMVLHLA